MSLKEAIITGIENLPEDSLQTVADFVNFMRLKNQEDNTIILSDTEKERLQTRYLKMQRNPEQNISLSDLKTKIFNQYQTP